MNSDQDFQKPIGYWLKRLDQAITAGSNRVLSGQGLTRFHWQVLNTVKEAGLIPKTGLLGTLHDFVDEPELDSILNEFLQRNWIVIHAVSPGSEDRFELTNAGLVAHNQILSLQSEVRRRLMEGIRQEEYVTVIGVLQKMVKNLEG